jgi:hypothetical protein
MKIWVVGNGQSRHGVALNQLNSWIIGCNAVHRDYQCNELVAVDQRMVNEILLNEQNLNVPVYTRQDWIQSYSDCRVRSLPDLPFDGPNKADNPFHWNSGPYAVLLASLKSPKEVHLLGFDLWSRTGLVNNLYKGTPNYATQESRKVSPDFWIYQLKKIFEHFDQIKFIQHQTTDWKTPSPWLSIKNLTFSKNIV